MGTLLETWEQRYTFGHDRARGLISLEVPGFVLLVQETDNGRITLTFEQEGETRTVECAADEAPKEIEALLFPQESVPR
jgi:hypothetical protein